MPGHCSVGESLGHTHSVSKTSASWLSCSQGTMGMQVWGPSLLSAMVQWPVGDWEARGMTALSLPPQAPSSTSCLAVARPLLHLHIPPFFRSLPRDRNRKACAWP